MKKKSFLFSALLFFSILPMTIFAGCDKDTNCYLEVQVVDSDKITPIPNAKVVIYQQNGSLIYEEIYTDGSGKYKTSYPAPSIIQVVATTPYFIPNVEGPIGERTGYTSARLDEGETVVAKVIIGPEVSYYDN